MRTQGIKNWTKEAREKSLAVRRAKGSVWGWDKRQRQSDSLTPGFDRLQQDLEEDAGKTFIRARTAEDELTMLDEDEYKDYLEWQEQNKRAEQAINDGLMAAIPVGRVSGTLSRYGKKAVGIASDTVNSSRAVVTAYDLSAPFRQGGIVSLTHPTMVPKAYGLMLKAAGSATRAKAIERLMRMRANYPLYKQSGLYLSEAGDASEEVFKAIFAKKIPGVNLSERAYSTYLNSIRVESFDSLLAGLKAIGKTDVTAKELEAIANYINVATGRGSIGAAEKYASELSTVFFAPKLTASRLQFIFGQPLYQGSLRSRLVISGEYGKYLAAIGTLFGLAKLSGGEVVTDMRSSDFGKIKFGENRIDPLSGLGKHAVLAARIVTGQFKSVNGKVESIYDDKGRHNVGDVFEQYVRSTLSPLYGTAVTLASGKGVDGKPYKAKDIPYDLLPLSARDIYEQFQINPPLTAMAMSLASLHGAGVDTYEKRVPKMTKAQVKKAIDNGEAFDAASLYK